MESQSVPTLDQLKEANSTSFDLHTKVFMYNSIIKGNSVWILLLFYNN